MNSDSTYQTNKKEIININNIYFEDSITDLINVLVKSIGDFYLKSLPLIKTSHQLIIPFESNLSKITSMTSTSQSDLYKIINELTIIKEKYKIITKDIDINIKIFKENAQKIFKELKNQKNNKVEDIFNDYAKRHSLKNNQLNINNDVLRKSNTIMNSNSSKNIKKEKNKMIDINNIQEKNIQDKSGLNVNLIKNLINKLGDFHSIIKIHSMEDYETFNGIQKQLLYEINKYFKFNTLNNKENKNQLKQNLQKDNDEKNPFIMVNNNNNNVTMTTTNNNSYYNIIDKDNLKDLKSVSSKADLTNELNLLKNKNITLEKKLKEHEEEMTKMKEEYELKYKLLNDKNTSLSKDLVNKNHEIQFLQNSNKSKISELTKMKLIVKNNEKQLKVQKKKVEQLKEKSPGGIKIKDLLGNKKGNIIDKKNDDDKNKEEIEKLENEIKTLKNIIDKNNEDINELKINLSEKNDKNNLFIEELNYKDNKIKDDDKYINNLKSEKDKLINKIKEHKNLEESYKLQIDTLKIQIKEMIRQQKEYSEPINNKYDIKKELKKHNNDLILENLNLKNQLEHELNYNKELRIEVKDKDIHIGELNSIINKLITEKENSLNKEMNVYLKRKKDSNKRINTDSDKKYDRNEKIIKRNKTVKYQFESDGKYEKEEDKKENERNKSVEEKRDFINKKNK
jgi:hypothetical protein